MNRMCAILNVAGSLSDIVDIKLEHIWDVSTAKLSAQNYSGYWRLELLTALAKPRRTLRSEADRFLALSLFGSVV